MTLISILLFRLWHNIHPFLKHWWLSINTTEYKNHFMRLDLKNCPFARHPTLVWKCCLSSVTCVCSVCVHIFVHMQYDIIAMRGCDLTSELQTIEILQNVLLWFIFVFCKTSPQRLILVSYNDVGKACKRGNICHGFAKKYL